LSEADALANEESIGWTVLASDDAREGMQAFTEKRAAKFSGR
jgi:enoyl-CoA hydratase